MLKRIRHFILVVFLLGQFLWNPICFLAADSMPSADEILEKYIKALGGTEALQKITSRVSKGSLEYVGEGTAQTLEIYKKGPDKFYQIASTLDGPFRQAYDGKTGWAHYPGDRVHDVGGAELARLKRQAVLQAELRMREIFPKMKVLGKEKVGSKDTFVIEASPPEGAAEKFYFDTQDGLLLQHEYVGDAWYGQITVTEQFGDFREVDGVRIPFTIRQSGVDLTIRIKELKHNIPIEDSKFAQPVE